jgi:hypothetical protein
MSTPSFLNKDDEDFLSKIDKNSILAISIIEQTITRLNNEYEGYSLNEKINPEIFETLKKKDVELLFRLIENLKIQMLLRESRLNSIRENRLKREGDAKFLGSSNGGKKMRKTRKTMRKRNKKRRSSISPH